MDAGRRRPARHPLDRRHGPAAAPAGRRSRDTAAARQGLSGRRADRRGEEAGRRHPGDGVGRALADDRPGVVDGGALPVVGNPFEVLRDSTATAETVGADAIPPLLEISATVDPEQLLVNGDQVRLEPLIEARPQSAAAVRTLDSAVARIDDVPSSWVGAVDDARNDLAEEVRELRDYVRAGQRAAEVLPDMLGRDRPRSISSASRRQPSCVVRAACPAPSASSWPTAASCGSPASRATTHCYPGPASSCPPGWGSAPSSRRPTASPARRRSYRNSNISPHFPYAARIWAAMWDGSAASGSTARSRSSRRR